MLRPILFLLLCATAATAGDTSTRQFCFNTPALEHFKKDAQAHTVSRIPLPDGRAIEILWTETDELILEHQTADRSCTVYLHRRPIMKRPSHP